MFWEFYQSSQIRSASQSAVDAASRSRNAETRAKYAENHVQDLQRRLDSITLACQAMWELVSENNNLTNANLLKRMQEVDLRDGKEDGKMTQVPRSCSACDRPVNPRRTSCMYCGEAMPQDEAPFNK